MKALVNKIIPFSSVDGPGNRTVIFLQGCNMNCLYCHNPETINKCLHCGICIPHCPVGALELSYGKVKWDEEKCVACGKCEDVCPHNATPRVKEYGINELVAEILKYKNFIAGITFSGGECTLQNEFITEVAQELKKHELTTFVDTNGLVDFSMLNKFVASVDKFMLDIKAWHKDEHIKLTDVSNETVIKNLKYLINENKLFEVRTVVVPNILSNELTVQELSKLISGTDIRYKLIKYRAKGVREDLINENLPNDEYMQSLKDIAEKLGVKDIVII